MSENIYLAEEQESTSRSARIYESFRYVSRRLLIGGMAATLSVSAACSADQTPDQTGTTVPVECANNPTPEEITEVKNFFMSVHAEDKDLTSTTSRELAQKYGLTIPDTEYGHIMSDTAKGGGAQYQYPIEDYLETSRDMLATHNIAQEVMSTPVDLPGQIKAEPFAPDKAQSVRMRNGLVDIVKAVADFPKELTGYYGLKKEILADLPENLGGVIFDPASADKFYMDPTEFTTEVFRHEFWHLIDGWHCGASSDTDIAYKKLAPPDFYENPTAYIAYSDIPYGCIERKYLQSSGKYQELKAFNKKYAETAERVAAYKRYGLNKEPSESKAVTGEAVLDPMKHYIFAADDYPILEPEFFLLLARLHKDVPNVAKYLIELGSYYGQC